MKVSFKLNNEQLKNARVIVAEAEKTKGDYESNEIWCGNLLGYVYNHYNLNTNQRLELEKGIVTYVGERHPLIEDGGLQVLKEIAQGDISKLRVCHYETSNPDLAWWETTSSWVWEKASLDQWLSNSNKLGFKFPNLGRMLTQDQKSCVSDIMAKKPMKQLSASYDAATIRICKKIAEFLEDYLEGFQNKNDKSILQAFNL